MGGGWVRAGGEQGSMGGFASISTTPAARPPTMTSTPGPAKAPPTSAAVSTRSRMSGLAGGLPPLAARAARRARMMPMM